MTHTITWRRARTPTPAPSPYQLVVRWLRAATVGQNRYPCGRAATPSLPATSVMVSGQK
jgi:hypothetical protein